MGLKLLLFRLNDTVLPPDLDLHSSRVGQTFIYSTKVKNFTGSFKLEIMKLAIFPACPSILLVPPFPGVPDDHHDIPNSTASSYIDGNHGAFDSRHFPQLWNKWKPWLGFNVLWNGHVYDCQGLIWICYAIVIGLWIWFIPIS
jgi:hypothetical protein